MREPTWQEIEAEAHRRGKLAFESGGRSWTIAEMIVEVMREGWTPPDPRREAFLVWHRAAVGDQVGDTKRIPDAQDAFYAGADWGEKHALELLTTEGKTAFDTSPPGGELALNTLTPVELLRAALRTTPPRPIIRPFPAAAGPRLIGWAGRHKQTEVFFIPMDAWKRLFKQPRLAARAVREAGFLLDQMHTSEKRMTHELYGRAYYLVRQSILEDQGEPA